jgi:hypothetical protein
LRKGVGAGGDAEMLEGGLEVLMRHASSRQREFTIWHGKVPISLGKMIKAVRSTHND